MPNEDSRDIEEEKLGEKTRKVGLFVVIFNYGKPPFSEKISRGLNHSYGLAPSAIGLHGYKEKGSEWEHRKRGRLRRTAASKTASIRTPTSSLIIK